MRDGLDDKMLGCVGSDQLTGIRTTRWSSEGEVSADGCSEADRASNAVREQQLIWCSTKQLRRKVRWHEQEIRFSWAGGKRYVTELVVLSGRVDIRAVTKARTLESKATEGGACVMEPLEAIQAVTVLDRYDCQYVVPEARVAPTPPETLGWMRRRRLCHPLTADDEVEWLHHERDVHLREFGCAAQHVTSFLNRETMLYATGSAARREPKSVQPPNEAAVESELERLWKQDIKRCARR